ncbi:hypothetical protein, partial [Rhodococcus sp. 06-418-5]|uniref:hypothetical protein n=1 Tax=Rhodococcus sp. 06-418-5 TaxID=2022507 RepID=UPI001C528B04
MEPCPARYAGFASNPIRVAMSTVTIVNGTRRSGNTASFFGQSSRRHKHSKRGSPCMRAMNASHRRS